MRGALIHSGQPGELAAIVRGHWLFLRVPGRLLAGLVSAGRDGDRAHHDAAAANLLTWKFSFTPPVLDISNP